MEKTPRSPTKEWRPDKRIKVKVLGLLWRGDSILACKVFADDGRMTGIRPPGGSVEFGETREDAILREFKEELGVDVTCVGTWHGYESIYEHEGAIGHEFVFVSDIESNSQDLRHREHFEIVEENGSVSVAEWFSLERIEGEKIELFPQGLREKIRKDKQR